MYLWTGEGLGRAPGPITTLRMRKDECPPSYERGERDTSRTAKGHLSPDVTQLDGRLLIADFGVNRFRVKDSTKKEKLLKEWLNKFERDSTYRLRIFGYSDKSAPRRCIDCWAKAHDRASSPSDRLTRAPTFPAPTTPPSKVGPRTEEWS